MDRPTEQGGGPAAAYEVSSDSPTPLTTTRPTAPSFRSAVDRARKPGENTRMTGDRLEVAVVERLWEALKRVRGAAVGRRLTMNEGAELYVVAKTFLRHAVNPVCAGCGREFASPFECERVSYAHTANRIRFDGLVCADEQAGGFDGRCAATVRRQRAEAGQRGIVTYHGRLSPRHDGDLLGLRATIDGELVPVDFPHIARA